MTAVDHAELKPCPFCGSAAKLETYGDRLGISCTECFCRTPLCQPGEDPLPIWNLRTQAPDSLRPDRDAVARVLKAWCEGGLLQDYASVADAILALRPQTEESGK